MPVVYRSMGLDNPVAAVTGPVVYRWKRRR